jgi:hypothetical protein
MNKGYFQFVYSKNFVIKLRFSCKFLDKNTRKKNKSQLQLIYLTILRATIFLEFLLLF